MAEPMEQRLLLCHSRDEDWTLWIEPLGDRVQIPKGVTVEATVTNPPEDCIEVEFEADSLTLHGWIRSVVLISKDGSRTCAWTAE